MAQSRSQSADCGLGALVAAGPGLRAGRIRHLQDFDTGQGEAINLDNVLDYDSGTDASGQRNPENPVPGFVRVGPLPRRVSSQMPNSRHSGLICSPSNKRATNGPGPRLVLRGQSSAVVVDFMEARSSSQYRTP